MPPRRVLLCTYGSRGDVEPFLALAIPCIICPFFGDQPGWAKLSVTLGVEADPVPRSRLSEDRLAAAIGEAVSSMRLRESAKHLATRLREENGVKNAIEIIAQAQVA